MNVPFLQNATFTGLVSTDEYYTSQEWSQAYDLSQNIFTNVQSNSGDWEQAYNIATFYSQNSAILIEQTTFSELTSLKASNQLKPGQYYQINDFELKWRGQGFYDPDPFKSSGVIEPLLVLALSGNRISGQAYSTLHPNDIVYYDIDATRSVGWGDFPGPGNETPPGFKGWITRRIDTINNINIGWDWRYIKVNCCKPDISSVQVYNTATTYNAFDVIRNNEGKLYFSIIDNNTNQALNNTNSWSPFTNDIEANTLFPTSEFSLRIGPLSFTPILSTREQLPTFASNNIGNARNVFIERGFQNIIIGTFQDNLVRGGIFKGNFIGGAFEFNLINGDFFDNTIGPFVRFNEFDTGFDTNLLSWIAGLVPNSVRFCKFGANFQNNLVCGSGFEYNAFGNNCRNNYFSRQVYNNNMGIDFQDNKLLRFTFNNVIGNSCRNNDFNTSFVFNKIGESFQDNTLGTNFVYNNIGNNFYDNTIDNFFQFNNVQNNFGNNVISTDFSYNNIENTFDNNIIGNIFQFNNIASEFQNNTTSINFIKTNIGNSVASIDFTGATHVYNNYDKNLFLNFDSMVRLSYFNSNDQLVVTDPTS